MRACLPAIFLFFSPAIFAASGISASAGHTETEDEYVYTADNHTYRIWIEHVTDSLYILHHETEGFPLSSWKLPYPVYRFCCGNLTGDELPEIAIGVIKPTRYFKDPAKRLFLFKLYKGKLIRPLWLGSQVGNPLEDFHIETLQSPNGTGSEWQRVHTIERKKNGKVLEGIYKYSGFGLKFERYL
ncbi:MAG: nuclear receptor-binding factor 2 [Bacteroides sp.]|nr:hypothetical protein [Roseburia sp.]MCM1347125.1 nuclear receptor-binding factor 2 [Bacteroides sp.]MCM1421586.1 nuclear receptor-binding factor 2 [Bacteroides sp.]